MGIEQSTMYGDAGSAAPSRTTKPNKIKRFNHFHSKPSHVIDLIVNQDWQKLLIATKTHQKEVFVAQKVRLFGVDRKVLPIHLVCAMSPPSEVIEALLKADGGMTTVKTPMKNYRKKMNRNIPFAGGSSATSSSSSKKVNLQKSVRNSHKGGKGNETDGNNFIDVDESDGYPSLMTPTTEPLSSFDASELAHDEFLPHAASSESLNKDPSNNIFFPEHKQDFALQITPSGDVRQISPNGTYCKNSNETESPFVYASQPDEVNNQSFLSNLSDDFLPLHIACLFKASADVIQLLIRAYPEAVEYRNRWGMLPIHIVCANIAMETPKIAAKKPVDDFTARRYLNNLYAVKISDKDDTWEINKIIELLVDANPQSLNIPSDNMEWLTPIDYVGKNFPCGSERDELLDLLKQKQNVSKKHDDERNIRDVQGGSSTMKNIETNQRTMLYRYLKMKDWDNAQQQLRQCPNEASHWVVDKEYDSSGSSHLPIHLACSNEAPLHLILLLSEAYPDGIKAKGKHSSNPLHIACKKCLDEEIILDFIDRCPETTCQKDEFGRLPLHLACKSKLSLSVMESIIQAYPESCTVKDYNGHTALTYYCSDHERCTLSQDQTTILFEKYGGLTIQSDELKDEDVHN